MFVFLSLRLIETISDSTVLSMALLYLYTAFLEPDSKCAIHDLLDATLVAAAGCTNMLYFTSSNFSAIIENALKMPSVGPVMVTILSGDDPSDMLMRAPLWKRKPSLFQYCIMQEIRVPFLTREMLKIILTSSLIFFTVSPFCIRLEINGIKESVGLVTIKKN